MKNKTRQDTENLDLNPRPTHIRQYRDPGPDTVGVALDLMLPDPDNRPSCAPQSRVVENISATISFNLGFPFLAQLVPPSRETPAMPKIAVDEYRDPLIAKNEIRPSWEIASLLFCD